MEEYREQTFDEERTLYGKTGVKLIDCRMVDTDLAFEKSEIRHNQGGRR